MKRLALALLSFVLPLSAQKTIVEIPPPDLGGLPDTGGWSTIRLQVLGINQSVIIAWRQIVRVSGANIAQNLPCSHKFEGALAMGRYPTVDEEAGDELVIDLALGEVKKPKTAHQQVRCAVKCWKLEAGKKTESRQPDRNHASAN